MGGKVTSCKRCFRVAVVLSSFTCAAVTAQSSTDVKKRNGTTETGALSSVIVLKEIAQATNNGKTNYTATYYLINGRSVASITEEGVKLAGTDVATCTVSQDVPPDDLDVLVTCSDASDSNPLAMAFTKDGGTVVRLKEPPTYRHRVIGEFRRVDGAPRLVKALEVVTPAGSVVVPVGDLVVFKRGAL